MLWHVLLIGAAMAAVALPGVLVLILNVMGGADLKWTFETTNTTTIETRTANDDYNKADNLSMAHIEASTTNPLHLS